jgi:hypothetical protein
MTARWKRIAARTVQTSAHCEIAKRRHRPRANGQALRVSSGIPGSQPHSHSGAALPVAALVLRCLKGGAA